MIRWKQEVDGFSDFGLDFGNPDFVAYAKSYGAKGSRVGSASEFSTMLEAAFREGGVHLIVARGAGGWSDGWMVGHADGGETASKLI
jgi:acetolactate synthase-1/2/3 large subunit